MLSIDLIIVLFFCISIVFAGVLRPQPEESLDPTHLTFPTHSSGPSRNVSVKGNLDVVCDAKLGNFSTGASCATAFGQLGTATDLYSFGWRNTGQYNIPLPFRIMSWDGLCFIEPFLNQKASVSHATDLELRMAAFIIIERCVLRDKPTGGVIDAIGGDGSLSLSIESYQPRVECHTGSGPLFSSCNSILSSMPVSTGKQKFGRLAAPDTEILLPKKLTEGTHRCLLTVGSTNIDGDTSNWYSIWAAAVAVHSMCVSKGKSGFHTNLGDHGLLTIEISIENPLTVALNQSVEENSPFLYKAVQPSR